ncbi:MAG: tetratricopeptide repeat protein [Parvibaculales bacterium]
MKKTLLALSLILPSTAMAEISYQDILKDPDNVALNREYASERLQQGDPKAALAAIERVLVQQPTNLPARLLRARILMAMGSDLQARGELEALAILPLNEEISQEVSKMLAALDRRQSRWTSMANISFGYLDGDNVNSFPNSGQAELPQGTSDFVSSNGAREFDTPVSDEALTSSISLYTEYDLMNQAADKLFFSLNASEVFDSDTEFMEYTSFGFSAGAKLNRFGLSIIPSVSYAEIDSNTQPDTVFENIGLNISKSISAKTTLYTTLSANRRDYKTSADYPSADNSDTETLSASIGASIALGNRWRANLSASMQEVEADLAAAQYNSKDAQYISLSLQGMIAAGQIVTFAVRSGESDHDAPDSGAQRIREDDISAYSVNYQLMGEVLHPALSGFRLIAGYAKTETESNILQFDNDKKTKSLMVSYSKPF